MTGTQVDQPILFRAIEKTPPASQTAESTHVSHSQALNIWDSLSSTGQAIHQPTPISIVDSGTSASNSNQAMPPVQPSGMPVSFASTTQVRSDVLTPPTVNTIMPPTRAASAPLLQIPSIASTANSQQVAPLTQVTADPCRKCRKKNHPTDRCHSKVTYKKCKGKDHGIMFCTVATTTAGYN